MPNRWEIDNAPQGDQGDRQGPLVEAVMPETGIESVKPDSFASLFFREGHYRSDAVLIPAVRVVSRVYKKPRPSTEDRWEFGVRVQGVTKPFFCEFTDEKAAQKVRNELMRQVEHWYRTKGL